MRIAVLVLSLLANAACERGESPPSHDTGAAARFDFQQWSLPGRLREISGLALTADERLFAVTDEVAVVYEIDYADGRLVKAFAFGDPPVRDDFEGIEVRDGIVWLMTSGGQLLAGAEGGNGQSVAFESIDTGLRNTCELEGLAKDADGGSLVLLCKEARAGGELQMLTWNPDSGERHRMMLPEQAIAGAVGRKDVNPSGITRSTLSGNYLVVAARQNVVFEVTADGRFVDVIMRLDEDRHRQAEGIAMTEDGRVLIADEAGAGSARLAVYRIYNGE